MERPDSNPLCNLPSFVWFVDWCDALRLRREGSHFKRPQAIVVFSGVITSVYNFGTASCRHASGGSALVRKYSGMVLRGLGKTKKTDRR